MCEYENLKDSEQKFNRDLVRTKHILDKSAVCMEFQRFWKRWTEKVEENQIFTGKWTPLSFIDPFSISLLHWKYC